MTAALRVALQAVAWLALAALVGVFAQGPAFAPVPAGHGELKFSLAHLTDRLEPCRQLTEEERQALPPTRRVREICERQRVPALIELRLDEQLLLRDSVRPVGLHSDGRAYLLKRWQLPAGTYTLDLALRDSPREDGFDYVDRFRLQLRPGDSALLELGDGDARLRQPAANDREPGS